MHQSRINGGENNKMILNTFDKHQKFLIRKMIKMTKVKNFVDSTY